MIIFFLAMAVALLACANGANDNFKGVASLYGSGTATYRTALTWATVTTFAGSACSIVLAASLLKKFSGKGIVPDALLASGMFLPAVAVGAGLTVILATRLGFPISTTHGLTGAMVGGGLAAAGGQVAFTTLGAHFLLPLLLSPVLAVGLGAAIYLLLRWLRLGLGITKESCICLGNEVRTVPIPQPTSVLTCQRLYLPGLAIDAEATCSERYAGNFIGMNCQRTMDGAHFLSAGVVSFARGLNDTPKMAALLLLAPGFDASGALLLVASAMAIGGVLGARRVAQTMSHGITPMNHGQGFAANLATGILVIGASQWGLPVSTTHVSVGGLLGIGIATRQAHYGVVGGVALSWLLTLPCAALMSAGTYWLLTHFAV